MLFIGGQRSLDANGNVVGVGDIEVQTEEAFRNLDTMLRAGGGDRHSLMRQNTYFRFFGEGARGHHLLGEDDQCSPPLHVGAVRRGSGAAHRGHGAGRGTDPGRRHRRAGRRAPAPAAGQSLGLEHSRHPVHAGLGEGRADLHWRARFQPTTRRAPWATTWRRRRATSSPSSARRSPKAGSPKSDVAKLYIYFQAEGDWAAIEAARETIARVQAEFYPDPGPAVTAIRVAGFAFENLLIEIEAFGRCRADGEAAISPPPSSPTVSARSVRQMARRGSRLAGGHPSGVPSTG